MHTSQPLIQSVLCYQQLRTDSVRVFKSLKIWLALLFLTWVSTYSLAAHADSLQNGGVVSGAISFVGEQDSWTFNTSAGDQVHISVVDINNTSLSALAMLSAPDGNVISTGQGNRVSKISVTAPQSGTYTLTIRDNNSSTDNDTGTGQYSVYLAIPPVAEHGSLINGSYVQETIELGDIDTWSFEANVGEFVQLSLTDINDTDLSAYLAVYAPDGSYITWGQGNTVSKASFTAAQTGTYTVLVMDNNSSTVNDTGTGDYRLYLAIPPVAEHGSLINGGYVEETIELGDIDTWSFEANVGEFVQLSLTDINDTNLSAYLAVYAPDGSYITWGQGNTVSKASFTAAQTGIYTVLVMDNRSSTVNDTGTGDYRLYLAIPPVAEHGSLIDGSYVEETIELGDIDTWSFEANVGDVVQLSLTDINDTDLSANLTVYAPDGSYVTWGQGNTVSKASFTAAQAGTYTVLVMDNNSSTVNDTGTGDYRLYLAIPPVAEHGSLINGSYVQETIELGDIDTWSFEASVGEFVQLSLTDINDTDLSAYLAVYAPDGSYVTWGQGNTVSKASFTAAQTGTYTVLVMDNRSSTVNDTGTGDYRLYLAIPPVAEHGSLINGGYVEESIELGDIDTWSFEASVGEFVQLSLTDINDTDLSAYLAVYAPDGSYVTWGQGNTVSKASFTVAQTGTYTALVMDNRSSTVNDTGTGDYRLYLARIPGANEHGQIDGAGSLEEYIDLGDLDTFTFNGLAGDIINIRVTDIDETNLAPFIYLFDQSGTYLTQRGGTTVAELIDYSLPGDGTYTLLVMDNNSSTVNDTGIGPYRLDYNLPDAPPDPEQPVAVAIAPAEAYRAEVINLDGSGSFDPDDSPQPLSYLWQLISVPDNSAITETDIQSANNPIASIQGDVSGEYRLLLTVDDGLLNDSAEVLVSVLNRTPVADAGEDKSAPVNTLVSLDGSGSSDADGDLITYQWQFLTLPAGSNATLEDAESVAPYFTPDIAGSYAIGLVVSDAEDDSPQDVVTIEVTAANIGPQASAVYTGDLTVDATISLDGSGSVDPDNGPLPLSYQWRFQSVPGDSTLDDTDITSANSPLAAFSADVEGSYVLVLEVTDGELSDDTALSINIISPEICELSVSAGPDITLELGNSAMLNNATITASDVCEAVTYQWQFVSVAPDSNLVSADISNADQPDATFVPDSGGSYVVQLQVSNADISASDSLTVTVTENAIPIANAGIDQQIELGETARLDAGQSYDPDNAPQPLTYLWQILSAPSGSSAVIMPADAAATDFTPDISGDYLVQLRVFDGQASDTDTMQLTVDTPAEPQMCDIDGNLVIDKVDIRAIMVRRNSPASGDSDRADWNSDGIINVLDARGCVLQCTLSGCATPTND
ncbi:PPC domain-containing protein [Lacimicrobium alkaliphilum]|uniref:PKD/Chitinase domain-containing protein n=1 Tax=Lacimicrobium alkaliphilum TaxID=1526571 RepID=A0ABQ1RAM0_9ALTE|nr:PPC domain-containing protein [Lacimicrobium alkaliphilum]GGD63320.1 hypothetical protein GCM10011357_18250 [Lacimicrobium alkaliphilum]